MFVTSVLLFSLFITVKCNNISTEPSKNDVQLLGEYYENDIAYQSGEDVILKSKGGDKGMDIILKNGFLEVEMDLNNCVGKSIFCYNSTDKLDLLNEMCFPGFCGFIVEGFNGRKDDGTYDEVYDVVKTLSGYVSRGYISESCRSPSIIRMQYWKTYFCGGGNYDIMDEYSCAPKMDKGNKIHIYVIKIAEQCPIKILNAEIVDPTEATTNSSITTIGTTTEKTEDASLPWYFWVIIFIVLIILLIFVLVAVLYWNDLCCFAKKKKPLPPPSDLNYVGVPQPKPPAEQEPKNNVISTKTLVSKESEAPSKVDDNASKIQSSANTTAPKDEKLQLKTSKPVVADKKIPIVKKSSKQLPPATSESDSKRNPKLIIKNEKEKKKEVQKKKPSAVVADKKSPPSVIVKSATSESDAKRNPKINPKNELTKDDSNKNVYSIKAKSMLKQ